MKVVKQFQKHLSLFLYNNFDKFYMRPTITCVRNNNHKGKQLVGVEIGSDRGHHSANIMRMLNIKKLYLIDCFIQDGWYGDGNERLFELQKRMKRYEDKYVLINGRSQEVADRIPDCIDFVYIDGGHDYDTVLSDCELYYPKVLSGGIFGGHDYKPFSDVKKVVDLFVPEDSELFVSKRGDWWFVKK